MAFLLAATPALAAVGASTTLTSEAWLRGYSVSHEQPTFSLDLTYDDPTGVYLGASTTRIATARDGFRTLGFQGNIGYAKRLKSGSVIDVGVVNTNYTRYWSKRQAAHYSEAYVGLVGRNLSSRVYFSPNYFGKGNATLYGEIDGVARLGPSFKAIGHVGLTRQLDGADPSAGRRLHYDWRVGVATDVRGFNLQLSQVGAGPGPDYLGGSLVRRHAMVLSVTRAF